jgi:hypothetical protein
MYQSKQAQLNFIMNGTFSVNGSFIKTLVCFFIYLNKKVVAIQLINRYASPANLLFFPHSAIVLYYENESHCSLLKSCSRKM